MRTQLTTIVVAPLLRSVFSINHQMMTEIEQGALTTPTGNAQNPGIDNGGSFFDTTFFAPLPTKPPTETPIPAPTETPTKHQVEPGSIPTPHPVMQTPSTQPPKPMHPPTFDPVHVPATPVPIDPHPTITSPPVSKPSSLPNPTHQPVAHPTKDPTKSPSTHAPIPIKPPTFDPAPIPAAPVPTVHQPTVTVPSVTYPISLPTYPDPPIPYKAPTPYVPPKPISLPTQPQVKIDTRTSNYKSEWGAIIDRCDYLAPDIFFNCHEGGIITVFDTVNAICTKLSDDFMQCRQKDLWFDSSVEFTCSGIKHSHLMATANVGSSHALNCAADGSGVKYLTISRTCYDNDGKKLLDKQPDCEVGQPLSKDDVLYCASTAACQYNGETCKKLELGSVTMGHRGKDLSCSRLDPTRDLQNYAFRESHLRSVNQIDWRFSGMGRGCQWEASPLLLRCENGGQLDFLETYPFCQAYPQDNMAVCQSFAPFSAANEETKGILVSCTGKNQDQLVLSVEIPSENLDVRCKPQGIAIQSIMLARGCGKYGTNSFTFKNDLQFCDDPTQVFVVDDKRSYCFVGDSCTSPNGCESLQLPVVSADTEMEDVGHCIYAV
ncbi:hypothetical protein IV203_007142 [Nitzschia inconspicua]|uniref:Uncharacterized protein n=1 Tax=Nitzschia inconspicua TaxID=303405 RepID=A0A9K3KE92_9STRA|nr:hypothetical protein IV203_007142 [Nitzschia inconspicua]